MSTTTEVKERGWPAHAHEIRAILDGRQSQFRRALSFQPNPEFTDFAGPEMYAPTEVDSEGEEYPGEEVFGIYCKDGQWGLPCPFGKPGDRLWVRETFGQMRWDCLTSRRPAEVRTVYKAGPHPFDKDVPHGWQKENRWRPSVQMPRRASRITLEMTDVRVERLHDMTDADAEAEGAEASVLSPPYRFRSSFHVLWDSINIKHGFGWDKNPWTRVVAFKRVTP
jgi:hypothetical protein